MLFTNSWYNALKSSLHLLLDHTPSLRKLIFLGTNVQNWKKNYFPKIVGNLILQLSFFIICSVLEPNWQENVKTLYNRRKTYKFPLQPYNFLCNIDRKFKFQIKSCLIFGMDLAHGLFRVLFCTQHFKVKLFSQKLTPFLIMKTYELC